jgi:hypothetical protein
MQSPSESALFHQDIEKVPESVLRSGCMRWRHFWPNNYTRVPKSKLPEPNRYSIPSTPFAGSQKSFAFREILDSTLWLSTLLDKSLFFEGDAVEKESVCMNAIKILFHSIQYQAKPLSRAVPLLE